MPGYEPYLLCDFHVHTRWSDGRLTLREVIDLYGQTGKFDVIAITDHILMRKDVLARMGRAATLGRRSFGIEEDEFRTTSLKSGARPDGRTASTACSSFRARRSRRTGFAGASTRTSSRSTSRSTSARISPPMPFCVRFVKVR